MSIGVSEFVKRQTPESRFSHYDGSWNELVTITATHVRLGDFISGYRSGVLLVSVPPFGFHSAVVDLVEGDQLIGVFEARQPGEEPRRAIHVQKPKQPAKSVQVVLYHKDVLAENNERSTDADWEIISINASPTKEEVPMTVGTMLANHFQVSGGTATGWSEAELVDNLRESFLFWKDKALACPGE